MAGSWNHFPQVAQALKKALGDIVTETATELQQDAASNAPVDTGFLKSSIYTVTAQGSTYGQAGMPPGDSYLLPETPGPPDTYTAYVAVGANYGIYQELGTRFMPPQPYFYPAIDVADQSLQTKLDDIESRL